LQIVDAVNKNGTFCDIGCANGHLMEMVHKWAAGIGYDLQMYGVDISEELIELAQRRLPEWHDNFFIGNAHYWKPEQKFDYIHTRGELVENRGPKKIDNRRIFEHYMENYLAEGGRYIIGPYWYENEDNVLKGLLSWGYSPTGHSEKTDYVKTNRMKKVMWVEKGSST
jgi:cyclopropane fatty-acyl-phospholipid synthase-like methyltransferase